MKVRERKRFEPLAENTQCLPASLLKHVSRIDAAEESESQQSQSDECSLMSSKYCNKISFLLNILIFSI